MSVCVLYVFECLYVQGNVIREVNFCINSVLFVRGVVKVHLIILETVFYSSKTRFGLLQCLNHALLFVSATFNNNSVLSFCTCSLRLCEK